MDTTLKLCLGMMVHNDAHWLRLHLPVYANCFDGMIVVMEPIETPADYACIAALTTITPNFTVYQHEFNNDWSEMYNHVIDGAEEWGYDAIVRLDPDEAIFPHDVQAIRELLETYSVLCFARYNFWQDRLHYTPGIFPDWQARAWQLNKGIRLEGQHHEGIFWPKYNLFEGDPVADTPRQVLRVPNINIYHYGNVGRERILERDLHYLNLGREEAGHPPLTERPADREFPTRHNIPFRGPQPLDPNVIGLYAPFEE